MNSFIRFSVSRFRAPSKSPAAQASQAVEPPRILSVSQSTAKLFMALAATLVIAGGLTACYSDNRVAGGGIETGNTGSLSGRVVNQVGNPVAHADMNLVEVKITKKGDTALTFRVVATDDSGRYQFDSLPEGRFALYALGTREIRLASLLTRVHLPGTDLRLADMTAKTTVTLVGRLLPATGMDVTKTWACIPGTDLCAHPGADSVYRIEDAPQGDYELVAITENAAHYLALSVKDSAQDSAIVYLKDVKLGDSADSGRVPYSYYPSDLPLSFSAVPADYPVDAEPAWYRKKSFSAVRYFILNDGPTPEEVLPKDFLAQWRYSLALNGDSAVQAPELSQALAGFPVPVRLSAPGFDFSQARPDGSDLVISDGAGRLLPMEIERWDAAVGKAEIWVRLDSLVAHKADRKLVLHWGRTNFPSVSNGAGVFRSDEGFIGAWHLSDTVANQAANARGSFMGFILNPNYDPVADLASVRNLTGIVGRGYHFDTAGSFVNIRQEAGLDVTNSFTIAIWARAAQNGGREQVMVSKWEPTAREWYFSLSSDGDPMLEFGNANGDVQGSVYASPNLNSANEWHHYAATFDHGTVHIYVDGVEYPAQRGYGTIPRRVNLFEADVHIGASTLDQRVNWRGDLDEFEYLSVAKPAEWISALYSSQAPSK